MTTSADASLGQLREIAMRMVDPSARPARSRKAKTRFARLTPEPDGTFDTEQRHDREAERAVLGSPILSVDGRAVFQRVVAIVDTDDFSFRPHQLIFAAMKQLHADGREIDFLTIKGEFSKVGKLEEAGGSAYISSLIDGIPNVAAVETYARIVASCATTRKVDASLFYARQALKNGPSARVICELKTILDACLKRESANNPEFGTCSLTSLPDFLSEPAPAEDWLVEGLFLRRGIVLLCAKPKAGKSTAARDAAFAVATATPFLGRKTAKGRVLFIALEEHRDRLRQQFAAMGFGGDEEIYTHVGAAPENGIAWLRELIAKYTPDMVCIDPVLKLVRVSDANDYAVTSAALEPLTEIARQSGACLLLVHHANKFGDGSGGDSVLGSTAIFGFADTVMLLKRRDDQVRTVSTIQRYGEDMPETVLEMDADTGLLAIAGSYQEMKLESSVARISEALKAGRPMTETEIRDAVGGDRTLVAQALRHAVKLNALRRSGNGKKGSPFRYEIGGSMLAF